MREESALVREVREREGHDHLSVASSSWIARRATFSCASSSSSVGSCAPACGLACLRCTTRPRRDGLGSPSRASRSLSCRSVSRRFSAPSSSYSSSSLQCSGVEVSCAGGCVCACACACVLVRACVRAWLRVRACACVSACVRASVACVASSGESGRRAPAQQLRGVVDGVLLLEVAHRLDQRVAALPLLVAQPLHERRARPQLARRLGLERERER